MAAGPRGERSPLVVLRESLRFGLIWASRECRLRRSASDVCNWALRVNSRQCSNRSLWGIATVREEWLINLCMRARYSDTGSISVGPSSVAVKPAPGKYRETIEARHFI